MNNTKKQKGISKKVWGCIGLIGAALITGTCAVIVALIPNFVKPAPTMTTVPSTLTLQPNQIPINTPIPSQIPVLSPTPANSATPDLPVAPTNIPLSEPTIPVLFEDNFSSGLNPAWIVLSGQPVIVNNALTAAEDTWLELSDSSWHNVKITISIKSNDCWFDNHFNEIGIRGDSPNNMVAFAWASCESAWGTVSSGKWQQVANSHWQGNLWDKTTFVISVKDTSFTASALGAYDTSVVLPNQDLSTGNIFFKVGSNTQVYSFKVEDNP